MAETVTLSGKTVPGLLGSLDPLLREWLPRQRWFAGKGRPITGFSLVAATELLPADSRLGLYHLLVRARQGPGPGDCYQLLLGAREALPPRLAPALIGHVTQGPLTGRTVFDALYDARPAEVLLEALRTRARVGALRCERDPGQEIRSGLVPRRLTGEQSNSSVVFGDTFILKLLRRVVPGVNPDLELPLALAREGCPRVPAPTAWLQADLGESQGDDGQGEDESYVLGVLQPYLQGAADGWELALRELAKGEDFVAEARALGRATAEVHGALARALPTATLGHSQIGPMVDGMTERLDAAAQAVPSLRPYAPALRTAFTALADLAAEGRTWTAQRVHGDLHLGQCLRTSAGEWTLIDFEGEPARPLAERRMPQPAVRDVAGMLRSFDYAAHSADPPDPGWAHACRAAYCSGYAEAAGADPRTDPVLLRAYETDKAVYEVVYEARHRPDWLPVPLSAIHRLAAPDLP
ncbi:phosphotransferase [Streptomyces sp. IBSBF 2953]|uniref:maltokinase N-terminal cap-like domain-containing protein n=1 Tax=Streptomyces TaxID=1883 RepID=UPI002119E675|nr:phosphotransferase [Streptomyces scabiei]MCQ9178229.1 phosphotransferase [Streptomyces hayashii]MDX3117285.1 phosphotransferase [Streptomyces scabiei]